MAGILSVLTPEQDQRRAKAQPHTLSDIIDELSYNLGRDTGGEVRLGSIVSAVGRRSYGPLLLVIGLFSISPATAIPGLTWASALVTLLIALQMAVGLKRPWLPKALLDLRVPRQPLFNFLDRARPKVESLENGRWLRTRWAFLSAPLWVNFVALAVVAAALITIPLGLIPLAPIAPGLAVVFFGVGMTARDGVWLLLGLAIFAAAFAIAFPLIF
ncbi:MAG: exopolysaccharide biosynthesis protein [Hyphomonadaceae bacterium]